MANPYASALGKIPRSGKVKQRLSPSHVRAKKQEKETAARIGGRLVPGSGARDVKGDVRLKKMVRVECKTTKHKSFSVTLDMVRKIESEALLSGELPVILVEFNVDGKPVAEVAVVPSYVLDGLCEK